MILRILFLTLFCLLSTSCSFTGDKSSSESPTTSQDTASNEQVAGKSSNASKQSAKQRRTRKTKPLELPPDLVGSANAKIQDHADAFADVNVLPLVVGARIHKQDDKIWLEIDTDVEAVWHTVSEYWITNGVNLVDYSPEAGTMETEWIKKETALSEEGSRVKQLFKSFLNSVADRGAALDKYRIRFERVSPDKTAMFVSHRATARKAIEHNKEVTEFKWVELPENPERVLDFLQNIILIFDQSAPA